MGRATEIILSGGSAGGLAVFYNLDHLATLLPKGVRLTGFPDAGFFLDAPTQADGSHSYRDNFVGADPVWNVTGSGGTNLKCLSANTGQEWKCLMAPYIAEHLETPVFVMNAAYDAWQMGNVLQTQCVPTPTKACTAAQNASLRSFREQFVANISRVTAGKPRNGFYLDGCYVHEQNVDYCSGQGMPNCVGWSPLEPGSKKWGYTTSVAVSDGRKLTPQEAFGAYYRGDAAAAVALDTHAFFDNPSCVYLGHPAPAPPPPAPPCGYFAGNWSDRATQTAVRVMQEQCDGTFDDGGVHTFTAKSDTITASTDFHGGITGQLQTSTTAMRDVVAWANGDAWYRNCSDFGGAWAFLPHQAPSAFFKQTGCQGAFLSFTYTVANNVIQCSEGFYHGLTGILRTGKTPGEDAIEWANGAVWHRNHTA